MIVRDVINTRPAELVDKWLKGLGAFDVLHPEDAAERWGVSLMEALERLHIMTGGPLEIPRGQVERYVRTEWTAEASEPSRATVRSYAEVLADRLALIPEKGATREELAGLWNLKKKFIEKLLPRLHKDGRIRCQWSGNKKIWFRTEEGKS